MDRVRMGRGEFKMYMFNVVNHCDDASFNALCDIFLTACGAVDGEGNLTQEYADSPYWKVEDGMLSPNYGEMVDSAILGVEPGQDGEANDQKE